MADRFDIADLGGRGYIRHLAAEANNLIVQVHTVDGLSQIRLFR